MQEKRRRGENGKQMGRLENRVKGWVKAQRGHPTSWYLLKSNETYVHKKTYKQVYNLLLVYTSHKLLRYPSSTE